MLNSQKVRSCEFCDEEVELEDYPQHLRSHHKMACTREDPQAQVKCMFCLEQMSEVDMFSHVFYGHNISGMFFSSAGGEEKGGETNRTSSNTVSVQTEETPAPSSETLEHRVSPDLQGDIEQSEISDNNNEELVAASEESRVALHSSEEELTPDCDEESLILLDDDESDFEMESPLPEPEVFGPSQTFKTDGNTSQPEDGVESEVAVIQISNSHHPCETPPDVDIPEPEVTLINVAKRKDLVAGPVKKVRFSDVTNYYPVKKRGKLKRGARKVVPLILGANTSLKYLKYWGTTNKPD